MGSPVLSDLLGWISIGCWLFAQFPQVVKNARRRSCESLALPFLFNWLLGDITNFIGCVLTHQLPFQTILAAYFCSVDLILFSQFFYYRSYGVKQDERLLPDSSPISRYAPHGHIHALEQEHYRQLSNAAANVAVAAALVAEGEDLQYRADRELSTDTFGLPSDIRRQLSSSTSDITLGGTRGVLGGTVPPLSPISPTSSLLHIHRYRSQRGESSSATRIEEAEEGEDEVDADALAALTESFHSDLGKKRVSWSQERYPSTSVRGGSTSRTRGGHSAGPSSTTMNRTKSSPLMSLRQSLHTSHNPSSDLPARPDPTDFDPSSRGRPLQRQIADSPTGIEDLDLETGDGTGTGINATVSNVLASSRGGSAAVVKDRKSSRASRRSAGLVFLGAWALFGVGTFAGSRGGIRFDIGKRLVSTNPPAGFVLPIPTPSYHKNSDPPDDNDNVSFDSQTNSMRTNIHGDESNSSTFFTNNIPSERVIGRMFAWTCATLYLTSRLPQIWKNFVRKSVDGLSMYLFVFAFLGNCFYVSSILTSPNLDLPRKEATAFLLESTPYLLGSGGTLMFDVTIVIQSFIYRNNGLTKPSRRRTLSTASRASRISRVSSSGGRHTGHGHGQGRFSTNYSFSRNQGLLFNIAGERDALLDNGTRRNSGSVGREDIADSDDKRFDVDRLRLTSPRRRRDGEEVEEPIIDI